MYPEFITATGAARLPDLARYLQAMQRRLEKVPERYQRDQTLLWTVTSAPGRTRHPGRLASPARRNELAEEIAPGIGWMIQEFGSACSGRMKDRVPGVRTASSSDRRRARRLSPRPITGGDDRWLMTGPMTAG